MNGTMRTQRRQYRVAALAALCVLAVVARPVPAAGPGVLGSVLVLNDKGQLTGEVVPGAVIEVKSPAGKATRVVADKNGKYRLDLLPGKYTFKVQAPGFLDEDAGRGFAITQSDNYTVHNFFLTRGKNNPGKTPPQIPPTPTGTLHGRVAEKTADGKLVGIPGAKVSFRASVGSSRLVQVVTREQPVKDRGRYEVGLVVGSYRASAAAPGFETVLAPTPRTVGNGTTATQDFVLSRIKPPEPKHQGIKGALEVVDSSASPGTVSRVKVSIIPLTALGQASAPFFPDAAGHFQRDLKEGRYRVVARAKGYWTYPKTVEVDVLRGRYTAVKLTLVPSKPSAKALVFVGTVYERVGESGKRPLPGATVLLRKKDEAISKAKQATTDEEGKVSLTVSAPGPYQAVARLSGYKPAGVAVDIRAAGPNGAEIQLLKDSKVSPPTVALLLRIEEHAGGSVRGVAGAQVVINNQEETKVKTGNAGADGRFVAQLAPGTYRVRVSQKDYAPAAPVEVALSKLDVTRTIVLTRKGPPPPKQVALRLRVLESKAKTSTGVAGAQVVISRGETEVKKGPTGADGRFEVQLAPGKYRVRASQKGYLPAAPVELTLDKTAVSQTLFLTRSDKPPAKLVALTLRVTTRPKPGAQPVPVAGAQVTVSQKSRTVSSGKSGPSGEYTAPKVGPGGYSVLVSLAGFQPARVQVPVADQNVSREIILIRTKTIVPVRDKLTLYLRVVEGTGKSAQAVGGATIVVSLKGHQLSKGLSGPKGQYGLANLRPGVYRVEVSRAGYQTVRLEVPLTDRDLRQDITLTRAAK